MRKVGRFIPEVFVPNGNAPGSPPCPSVHRELELPLVSGSAEGKSLHLPEPEQFLIPLRRDALPGAPVPRVSLLVWGLSSFISPFSFPPFLNLPFGFWLIWVYPSQSLGKGLGIDGILPHEGLSPPSHPHRTRPMVTSHHPYGSHCCTWHRAAFPIAIPGFPAPSLPRSIPNPSSPPFLRDTSAPCTCRAGGGGAVCPGLGFFVQFWDFFSVKFWLFCYILRVFC